MQKLLLFSLQQSDGGRWAPPLSMHTHTHTRDSPRPLSDSQHRLYVSQTPPAHAPSPLPRPQHHPSVLFRVAHSLTPLQHIAHALALRIPSLIRKRTGKAHKHPFSLGRLPGSLPFLFALTSLRCRRLRVLRVLTAPCTTYKATRRTRTGTGMAATGLTGPLRPPEARRLRGRIMTPIKATVRRRTTTAVPLSRPQRRHRRPLPLHHRLTAMAVTDTRLALPRAPLRHRLLHTHTAAATAAPRWARKPHLQTRHLPAHRRHHLPLLRRPSLDTTLTAIRPLLPPPRHPGSRHRQRQPQPIRHHAAPHPQLRRPVTRTQPLPPQGVNRWRSSYRRSRLSRTATPCWAAVLAAITGRCAPWLDSRQRAL